MLFSTSHLDAKILFLVVKSFNSNVFDIFSKNSFAPALIGGIKSLSNPPV
jgi:hypothetical protein